MTRSSPIRLRRRCRGSVKSWPSLAATSRFGACGASAIFSGPHVPNDVDHQDTDAFARPDCNGNLSRHARHRHLARSGGGARAYCQTATAILNHATVVDPGHGLIVVLLAS